MAYDLRNAPNLQERPGIDIFAVFHAHTEIMDADPDAPEAPLYPAITRIHVFHGQVVYNPSDINPQDPTEWRVWYGGPQGRDGPNRRTLINQCRDDEYWFPGEFNRNLLENFGSLLRTQGWSLLRIHADKQTTKKPVGIFRPETYHNWVSRAILVCNSDR